MANQAATESERLARASRALELRVKGWLYDRIGEEIGVSGTQARLYVLEMLDRTTEHDRSERDQIRKLQNLRTENVLKEVLAIIEEERDSDLRLRAVDRYLKAEERLAKSLGTDAPEQAEVAIGIATPEAAAAAVREEFRVLETYQSDDA